MTAHRGPCQGCRDLERLGRRRFLRLLGTGVALALAGCTGAATARSHRRRLVAPSSTLAPTTAAPPPQPTLPPIPPPRPGPAKVISAAPRPTPQIALTIDDGYCGDCIARYVEFAHETGLHITFSPNGVYRQLWTAPIVTAVRDMVTKGQVQIGNHTWDHANLLGLSNAAIASELTRNEDWIQQTFGITARPYFRPPYGKYDRRIINAAGGLGYTSILMWNGTLGDATEESPSELIGLAEQWLQPGNIVLGHLNHPTVLSLFGQLQQIIASRHLEPVTLDEMFGTSRATG